MIKYMYLVPLLLLACNDTDKKNTGKEEPVTAKAACYEYTSNRDTAILQLTIINDSVTGSLVYNFFEKDRNTGTIRGTIKNGILLADYHFMSEGMQSIRQVAFKKTGENFTEGNGEVLFENERLPFANPDSLDYSGIVLKPSNCK